MHDARLTELEIRLAYQEQTINDLNEVILTQQADIELLKNAVDQMRTKLETNEQSFGPASERPPHY
jgi:SlyX protein